jgi:adenosylcobinamide-GDP ribazoletransferase
VGAILLLLSKFAAVLALPEDARPAGFLAMGAVSRWTMVYAAVRYPVARPEGLGFVYKQSAGRAELAIATAIAAIAVLPAGFAGAGVLIGGWLLTVSIANYAQARIGGFTGDVYGATSEVVETGVLIALPPMWRLTAMLGAV